MKLFLQRLWGWGKGLITNLKGSNPETVPMTGVKVIPLKHWHCSKDKGVRSKNQVCYSEEVKVRVRRRRSQGLSEENM